MRPETFNGYKELKLVDLPKPVYEVQHLVKSRSVFREREIFARVMAEIDGNRSWRSSARSILGANWVQNSPNLHPISPNFVSQNKTFHKSFGMYGGDDGARTRDPCRDRTIRVMKS